ncbi:MAG: hypothetical protein K6B70_05120 [Clostridia bacterium]|nr:hypothetical protein [Clostridia bacterium]
MIIESISLNEIITYSKKENSPSFTIIDELTEELQYVEILAERLRINILRVENTNMVAVVNHKEIAIYIAKELKKKCQYMFYDLLKRPSVNFAMYAMTGYTPSWITIRDNGYVVESYNADGEIIDNWINTDIEEVSTENISKLNLNKYIANLRIRGVGNSNRCNETIIELSRYFYINGGIYRTDRGCYYPKENKSNKGKADYNRLEKLFKRWGFESL